jgi:cytochrome c
MDFLNNLFLPPSANHLHLVKYIILIIYFIHLPFISLVIGGTFFSFVFRLLSGNDQNSRNWRVSREFINRLVLRKMAGIFLGVLPLIILMLIEGQVFYDADISVVPFMLITNILVATGITLVYFYQYSFRETGISQPVQIAGGALALFFLFTGYFVFSVNSALILDPGRWAIVNSPLKFLFSWNVIARFLHFICAAFAVSGVAMIFFMFNWKESDREKDVEFADYMKKLSGGIAIGFTLIQPVLIFWNLITLPDQALSGAVYLLTVLVLFLLFIITLTLYRLLKESRIKLGNNVFVLFVVTFIVMIVNDHEARENSIENQTRLLTARAEEVRGAIQQEREAAMATSFKPDIKLGEEIYNKQCSACHRFDQKLVGPAYDSVLPKYENNRDELIKFIRNPYKIEPGYPPMPKLGLSEKEIMSVAEFLLQHEKNKNN